VALTRLLPELDGALDRNDREVIQAVFLRFFPVTGCDVARAITIVRQSRHFARTGLNGSMTVIAFENIKQHGDRGTRVTFGLHHKTGESVLPAVYPVTASF
jgi:hypothetical protein